MKNFRPLLLLSLTMALATMIAHPQSTKAYNTMKDSWGNETKWQSSTIKWYLHPQGSDDVPFQQVKSAIQSAFLAWQSIPCLSKTFIYGGTKSYDPQDGVFIKFKESDWDPTVKDALAYAQNWKSPSGEITNAVIVFNGVDTTWTTTEASDFFSPKSDIQGVATHEIGHVLGLDHSRYRQATMFFSGSSEELRSLEQDDKDGICYLYSYFIEGKPCDACSQNYNCKGGYCIQYPDGFHYCGKNCYNDSDCPQLFWCYDMENTTDQCVPENGYCSQEGGNIPLGYYCYGHETCKSGFCLVVPDTAYCSKECTSDSQCNGLKCIAGLCMKGGNAAIGQSCQVHSDCQTLLCVEVGVEQGICSKECSSNSQCPAGFKCTQGFCFPIGTKAFGEECQAHLDCQSLYCAILAPGLHAICTQECTTDSDCPAEGVCAAATCVPKGDKKFGQPCSSPFECVTGVCTGSPNHYCTVYCDGPAAKPCPAGSNCLLGGYCSKGEKPGCSSDSDCKSYQFCKLNSPSQDYGECVLECNPFADIGCPTGKVCKWYYIYWLDKVTGECVGANGGTPIGGSCDPNTGLPCENSLICANFGGTGLKCYKDCDVENGLGCGATQLCVSLEDTSDPRHGICVNKQEPRADAYSQDVSTDATTSPHDAYGATDAAVKPETAFIETQQPSNQGDGKSHQIKNSGGCSVSTAQPPGLSLLLLLSLFVALIVVRHKRARGNRQYSPQIN